MKKALAVGAVASVAIAGFMTWRRRVPAETLMGI